MDHPGRTDNLVGGVLPLRVQPGIVFEDFPAEHGRPAYSFGNSFEPTIVRFMPICTLTDLSPTLTLAFSISSPALAEVALRQGRAMDQLK